MGYTPWERKQHPDWIQHGQYRTLKQLYFDHQAFLAGLQGGRTVDQPIHWLGRQSPTESEMKANTAQTLAEMRAGRKGEACTPSAALPSGDVAAMERSMLHVSASPHSVTIEVMCLHSNPSTVFRCRKRSEFVAAKLTTSDNCRSGNVNRAMHSEDFHSSVS